MSESRPDRPANRLGRETSPYLLQHARNPVDWYPWGDEAFAEARKLDRPIFLSVGYSACHWCHVMEHESFENDEIARILNSGFISIKVDREERPDVDQIYMTAVQLLTHRGGWPMSVFMTPDGEPFFGGTYWPPHSRMGMPGFRDILVRISQIWSQQREEAFAAGRRLTSAIERVAAPAYQESPLTADLLQDAMGEILSSFDPVHGGFGSAPKFPHPMDIRLLLRCARRFDNSDALHAARHTLDKMAAGGIYDHLGGGFHRYSTDARWLVPHFEKMLYDNALLVPAFLEGSQLTSSSSDVAESSPSPSDNYTRIVRETLDYVLREMTSPEGGYYSTQDADSEGEEGKFFVWFRDEVLELLGQDAGELFCQAYDVLPRGNWEGTSILNRPVSDTELCSRVQLTAEELHSALSDARKRLFAARSQRVAPGRDEKILTGWNGLMIEAMAHAGRVLAETRYTASARSAAEFILAEVRDDAGRLLHTFKDSRARLTAYLDDYACFISGLTELYQATFEPHWLEVAVDLAEQMQQHFADPSGGFFYTADDHERLITRTKDFQDNATPSGNSVAATALLKLGRITGRSDLEESGYQTLVAMSGLLTEHPRAAAQGLIALDWWLGPAIELVIVDGNSPDSGDALLASLAQRFTPRLLLVRRATGTSDDDVPNVLQPLLSGRAETGTTQFFVCEAGACQLPVERPEAVLKQLGLD
ncbi:MAG: thioredoxin domain-containing protein [Planctomycetaceae bacterium]|nr:thioredoxin domain-containing protein [Planctomycetaceae bacterium]